MAQWVGAELVLIQLQVCYAITPTQYNTHKQPMGSDCQLAAQLYKQDYL